MYYRHCLLDNVLIASIDPILSKRPITVHSYLVFCPISVEIVVMSCRIGFYETLSPLVSFLFFYQKKQFLELVVATMCIAH